MIELVFIACIAWSPTQCEQRSLIFSEISMMTCMVGAQGVLAEWVGARPGWRVARWSCGPLRQRARDI